MTTAADDAAGTETAAANAAFAANRSPHPSGRVRVVLVDDHEAVRSGVRAILATDPAISIVGEAENGMGAAALCLETEPDVALVDIRMPGTDGVWATERITGQGNTRVIILTTYDTDELISSALAAGAHGYLLKSVRGAELIQAVHHVAADRHVLDPAIAGGVIARLAAAEQARQLPSDNAALLERLTERERDVLVLLGEGLSNQQIAEELHVSITTVKTHVGALYAKTGATSRVQLGRLSPGA